MLCYPCCVGTPDSHRKCQKHQVELIRQEVNGWKTQFRLIIIDWTPLTPNRYTHIEKSLFVDVFGSSNGRRGDHHRLHLRQVNVSPAVGVLTRVVVPQLRARPPGTLEADVHSPVLADHDGGGSPGVW